MYRTGDLVRAARPDGNLTTSAAPTSRSRSAATGSNSARSRPPFAAHPAVRFAAAVAQPDPQVDGAYRLAAYLVLDGSDLAAVAAEVGTGLPDFLRPTHYAQVDGIPLTVNGKADTKALPEAKPLGALTTRASAARRPRTRPWSASSSPRHWTSTTTR